MKFVFPATSERTNVVVIEFWVLRIQRFRDANNLHEERENASPVSITITLLLLF